MRTREEIEGETSVSIIARIEPFLMTTGALFSGDVQALSEQMTRFVATNLSARFTEQHKDANLFVAVAVQRGGASGGFEYREGEYAEMKHATDETETDAAALRRIAAENVNLLDALGVAEAEVERLRGVVEHTARDRDTETLRADQAERVSPVMRAGWWDLLARAERAEAERDAARAALGVAEAAAASEHGAPE